MAKFDPANLERNQAYRLMISCLVPRPIAWVSSVNASGIPNLAPFSYFGGVSSNPPTISLSVGRRGPEKKDTWANIEATKDFVVNVVTEELAPRMVQTSGDYPEGVSEFAEVGLTPVASDLVRPPRVAESPIQMECRAVRILEVGREPDALILGEILRFHVRDELLRNGVVNPEALHALGRLGGAFYCATTRIFEYPRPRIERHPTKT